MVVSEFSVEAASRPLCFEETTLIDVRMRGFARRHTVEAALARIDAHLRPLESEVAPLSRATGRVLADDVVSRYDVPGFDRAMMDGYALLADSTSNATTDNPVSLTVVGDAFPGRPFEGRVSAGEAVRIMTGAPLPAGCDAIVPAESVDASETTSRVKMLASVAAGTHLGRRGEDIVSGTTIFRRDRALR